MDHFIRIEEYLSKKLDESCALFKILIVNKTSNGQQLSRDEFERIKRDARQQVKNLFREDCLVLEVCFPNFQPMIRKLVDKAMKKMNIVHDLE